MFSVPRTQRTVDKRESSMIAVPSSSDGNDYTIQNYDAKSDPYKRHWRSKKWIEHGNSTSVVAVVRSDRSSSTSPFARKEFLKDGKEPTRKKRLQEEANTMSKLDAENPTKHRVTLEAAYTIADTKCFLVTKPFANGGKLSDIIGDIVQDESQRTEQRLAVLRKATGCLAVGLAALHSKGFRHRDLHPGNILFHNGEVLYCDFGASLHIEPGARSTTNTRRPPRMERYAAPEVISAGEMHNKKSEIYPLGAMLYEIHVAIYAYEGDLKHLRKNFFNGGWRYCFNSDKTKSRWCNIMYERTSGSESDFLPFWGLQYMLEKDKEARPSALTVAAIIYATQVHLGETWMCTDCADWIQRFGSGEIKKVGDYSYLPISVSTAAGILMASVIVVVIFSTISGFKLKLSGWISHIIIQNFPLPPTNQ